jgi:Zn-dependent hydrolases, including glyoxylases
VKFGNSEIYIFNDGTFTLDTGAAFGIIPKNVWSKRTTVNSEGRVSLQTNIPVIVGREYGFIIDTGLGKNPDPVKSKWFQVEKKSDLAATLSESGIDRKITHILHSHMHFDHMGHTFEMDQDRSYFLNKAIPVVNRKELNNFKKPNEFTKGSYIQWQKDFSRRKSRTVEGTTKLSGGMKIMETSGHTSGHCAFLYEDGDSKLTYFGDLVPNTFYLKAGYLTAIDTYPMETIIQKKKLIKQAIREKRLCFFSHDMKISAAFLSGDESNPEIEPVNVNE